MSSFSGLSRSAAPVTRDPTTNPLVKKIASTQQPATATPAAPTSLATATPSMSTTQSTQAAPAMQKLTDATSAAKQGISGGALSNIQRVAAATAPSKPTSPTSASDSIGSQWQDPTAYANKAQDAITSQEATATKLGGDQTAALERRAATLAALSGRGLGGGFLQGQTQAVIEGTNNTQQQINQLEQQRQQIYGQEASQAYGNQQQNKQNAFGLEQQTAENTAQATAQQTGAQKQTDISNAQAALNAAGINVAAQSGPAWGTFKPLIDAMNSATDPAAYAAAKARLDAAMGKLSQLKSQNTGKKGEDWNAVVKKAERDGYFNS